MSKDYSVSSILFPSLNSNLDGISADIFLRGCKAPHCPGCHNTELQNFVENNKSLEDIISSLKPHSEGFSVITIMGGEPLDSNHDMLLKLLTNLRLEFPEKKLALYTGYGLSTVIEMSKDILEQLDYIKCGRYDETNRAPFGSFLATKNQIMYQKLRGCWSIQYQYQD